jgi:Fur family ferric uptake transcriptional regulator
MNSHKELIYFPDWIAGRDGYAKLVREKFVEYINSRGQFFTPQRAAILDELLKADRHLSQDEIYAALKSRGIGKVTVFRTLKMLEESRLVDKVNDADGMQRYEINKERPHHDHLICLHCNRIMEVRWPEVEKMQDKECQKLKFEVAYRRHEMFGRCEECGQKNR